MRPRSVAAALDGLAGAYPVVVADTDADLEGEEECGSVEIEERNVLARSAVDRADLVLAVGTGDLKGLHALIRLLWRLRSFGVPTDRLVPVVNRAPRQPRARAELTRAIRDLGFAPSTPRDDDDPGPEPNGLAGVVLVPNVRRVDQVVRDGGRLPDALGQPLARAVDAVLGELGPRVDDDDVGPQPVRPGDLGHRFDDRAVS